jgi:hypothetical protein
MKMIFMIDFINFDRSCGGRQVASVTSSVVTHHQLVGPGRPGEHVEPVGDGGGAGAALVDTLYGAAALIGVGSALHGAPYAWDSA